MKNLNSMTKAELISFAESLAPAAVIHANEYAAMELAERATHYPAKNSRTAFIGAAKKASTRSKGWKTKAGKAEQRGFATDWAKAHTDLNKVRVAFQSRDIPATYKEMKADQLTALAAK